MILQTIFCHFRYGIHVGLCFDRATQLDRQREVVSIRVHKLNATLVLAVTNKQKQLSHAADLLNDRKYVTNMRTTVRKHWSLHQSPILTPSVS